MLLRLMYYSIADETFEAVDLAVLTSSAQQANAQHAVTGFLCYNGAAFLQFLEGTEEAVWRLFSNIERDVRHHTVLLLATRLAGSRAFSNWSMSFLLQDHAGGPSRGADSQAIDNALSADDPVFRHAFRQFLNHGQHDDAAKTGGASS